eukprot:366378-Chlamydomonas_euryale.AAC.9
MNLFALNVKLCGLPQLTKAMCGLPQLTKAMCITVGVLAVGVAASRGLRGLMLPSQPTTVEVAPTRDYEAGKALRDFGKGQQVLLPLLISSN